MSGAGVLTWPWANVLHVLRLYGPDIGKLAVRGDKLAAKLVSIYRYAYDHPNDANANRSLRACLNEYLQRDLVDRERAALGAQFGHQLGEEDSGPRIVVPGKREFH